MGIISASPLLLSRKKPALKPGRDSSSGLGFSLTDWASVCKQAGELQDGRPRRPNKAKVSGALRIDPRWRENGTGRFLPSMQLIGQDLLWGKETRFFLIILQPSATKTDIIEHYSRFFSIRGFLYQQNSTSKSDSPMMRVCACAVCTCVPLAISIHLHPISPIAYNWS